MTGLVRQAKAGIDDRGDVVITLTPVEEEKGISISIESKVETLFADQIEDAVRSTLESFDITGVAVTVKDNGALDYVIRARTETAISRAMKPMKGE